jgi:hypothetical protein
MVQGIGRPAERAVYCPWPRVRLMRPFGIARFYLDFAVIAILEQVAMQAHCRVVDSLKACSQEGAKRRQLA